MMGRIKHIMLLLVLAAWGFSGVAQKVGTPGYPAEVLYGVNNFARITVRELANGSTRFFVPGKLNAKRVILSGNFNTWSTLKSPMLKTDSGWVRDVKLEPGIYAYKFIINGNWQHDQNNNLKEDDGFGGNNSIYYRYNYSFKLAGFNNAHRVIVAGDFNKWNAGELIMAKVNNGWQLNLYLHDGPHQYRFLVDGRTVTDPGNKTSGKDAAGNRNSVLSLGQTINFRLAGYQRARKVFLAGTFNNWQPNDLQLQNRDGVWTLPFTLPAGNYQYKFIVDDNWILDPTNQHKGRDGDEINSFIAVSPNYTFRLKGYNNAKTIKLSGTFNDWSKDGYTLEHTGNEWTISLRLKPGKYLYKFIVDGDWITDPGNKFWEQNEHHTGNSVLWIE